MQHKNSDLQPRYYITMNLIKIPSLQKRIEIITEELEKIFSNKSEEISPNREALYFIAFPEYTFSEGEKYIPETKKDEILKKINCLLEKYSQYQIVFIASTIPIYKESDKFNHPVNTVTKEKTNELQYVAKAMQRQADLAKHNYDLVDKLEDGTLQNQEKIEYVQLKNSLKILCVNDNLSLDENKKKASYAKIYPHNEFKLTLFYQYPPYPGVKLTPNPHENIRSIFKIGNSSKIEHVLSVTSTQGKKEETKMAFQICADFHSESLYDKLTSEGRTTLGEGSILFVPAKGVLLKDSKEPYPCPTKFHKGTAAGAESILVIDAESGIDLYINTLDPNEDSISKRKNDFLITIDLTKDLNVILTKKRPVIISYEQYQRYITQPFKSASIKMTENYQSYQKYQNELKNAPPRKRGW